MDYRDGAPFSEGFWKNMDEAVVNMASCHMTGRRFLTIFGPLGPGAQSINIDSSTKQEEQKDGMVRTSGRDFVEIPQIYADFTLLWRDLESYERNGYPTDLSAAQMAAETCARKEDELIFHGSSFLGVEGLLNVKGANKQTLSNWGEGENAFTDVAKAVTLLSSKGMHGRYALVVSPDLYLMMQRIQPGTGVMEIDRVKALVDSRLFKSSILGTKKAVLVCAEPQYMDLVIGQDMITGYLEMVDFNHHFRILETVLPRIKRRDAVVVFG